MKVVIKLSGESLGNGQEKFDEETLKNIALQVKKLLETNHQIALVVGGGNLFRGSDLAGRMSIEESTAHYIGMLATVQNALVLRDYFEGQGITTRVSSAITMQQVCEAYIPKRTERHLDKGRVVIFAAGLGAPFFSTDTTSVQRALELKADILVMAKNGINKLYTDDPKKNKDAQVIDTITASELLERNLKVADQAAIALAKEHGLVIKVVGIDDIVNMEDKNVGSTILAE